MDLHWLILLSLWYLLLVSPFSPKRYLCCPLSGCSFLIVVLLLPPTTIPPDHISNNWFMGNCSSTTLLFSTFYFHFLSLHSSIFNSLHFYFTFILWHCCCRFYCYNIVLWRWKAKCMKWMLLVGEQEKKALLSLFHVNPVVAISKNYYLQLGWSRNQSVGMS